MDIVRAKRNSFLAATVAAVVSITVAFPASAFERHEARYAPQQSAASGPEAQSLLANIRAACPLLGDIVEELALQDLGEAFPHEGPKFRSGMIMAAVASATAGDTASLKYHARIALDAGATMLELGKLLYLTAATAGAPPAIDATRVLAQLLNEPHDGCLDRATRLDPRHF